MARRKRSKRWLYWLLILVLLIAAVVVCYLVWDTYFRDKDDSQNLPENSKVEDSEKIEERESTESDAELKSETVEKKKVEQYEGNDPNKAEELSGVITYAGVSGPNLTIRVNIDQYLENGKCSLTLNRSGATIYNSIASIIGGPSTSSCEGFDVPVSGLGGGAVEIIIKLEAGGRTGTIRGEASI